MSIFILGKDETGRDIVRVPTRKASQGLKSCLLLNAQGSVRISKRFLFGVDRCRDLVSGGFAAGDKV